MKLSKGIIFVLFLMITGSLVISYVIVSNVESGDPVIEYSVEVPNRFNASYCKFTSDLYERFGSPIPFRHRSNGYESFPVVLNGTARVGTVATIEVDYFGDGPITENVDGLNVRDSPSKDLLGSEVFTVEIFLEDNHEVSKWGFSEFFVLVIPLFIWNIFWVYLYLWGSETF